VLIIVLDAAIFPELDCRQVPMRAQDTDAGKAVSGALS
jgi:hypothetical protein